VLLVAVLHLLPDDADAYGAVATLMAAMSAGSVLVLSHDSTDLMARDTLTALAGNELTEGECLAGRTWEQINRFFADSDLRLIEPGLTTVSEWRPNAGDDHPPPDQVPVYGGVAIKPASRHESPLPDETATFAGRRSAAPRTPNQRFGRWRGQSEQPSTSTSSTRCEP
jgi:hypothetical protein